MRILISTVLIGLLACSGEVASADATSARPSRPIERPAPDVRDAGPSQTPSPPAVDGGAGPGDGSPPPASPPPP
ncbi:MAG TPA: hypothetical protein VLQ79_05800, partial [Myxococcaceae bacterium]|nr:hypothetical protein [Myxococcaceae bacterium]